MSLSLATKGYLGSGATGSGGSDGPTIMDVSAQLNVITVQFSQPVTLTREGEDLHLWEVLSLDGSLPVQVTGVTNQGDEFVYLTTTEQKTGAAYQLWVPAGGVQSSGGGNFEDDTRTFNGSGVAPYIASAVPLSLTEVLVTFSEAVDASTATVAANYVFDPAVEVLQVVQVSAVSFKVITARQRPLTIYQVTVDGVLDLAGNDVASQQPQV